MPITMNLTDITIDYILRRSKNVLVKGNSLDDTTHQDYIVFKRGRKGTRNYECGTIVKRMAKKYITWDKSGQQCNNGLDIWEIREK